MLVRGMETIFRWGYSRGGAERSIIPQSCDNNNALFHRLSRLFIRRARYLLCSMKQTFNFPISPATWRDRAYFRKINRLLYAVFAFARITSGHITRADMHGTRSRKMQNANASARMRASESVRFARRFSRQQKSEIDRILLGRRTHAATEPFIFLIRYRHAIDRVSIVHKWQRRVTRSGALSQRLNA